MITANGRLRMLAEANLGDPKQFIKAAVNSGLAIVLNKPGDKKPVCTEPPSRRNGKHPEGGCGVNHAITDPNLAYRAFENAQSQYPDQVLNIGIHAGKSNMAFVDMDTPEQLDAFIAAHLRKEADGIPLTVNSPGKQDENGEWIHYGGGHIYLDTTGIELPDTVSEYVDPAGWKLVWGNHQVIAPPSIRAEGPYTFSSPEVRPISQWLQDIAWNLANGRNDRPPPGEPGQIDEWSTGPWTSELLRKEDGWINEGQRDGCGCPIWWLHGRGDHKSATAHEPGCSGYDTSRGHGPLHLWSDVPPDFLRQQVLSGRRTFTKIQYLAHAEHHGNIREAIRAAGIVTARVSDEDLSWNPSRADDQSLGWEADFWSSRESLAHISTFAYSRLAPRWGVLGVCILRALHYVPVNVTLPGLIGGEGHFNTFMALVAPSGLGKGTSERCARDVFSMHEWEPVYDIDVGSGEGIAHQYKHYQRGHREPVWDRTAVLFKASEVDQLAALGKRQGSTLLPQLRAAFSGESLGFAYADQTRRLPMEAGTYRFGLMVGVQPAKSWILLNDSDGGTPQRFVWLPAFDPSISVERPDTPKPMRLDVQHSELNPWRPGPVNVPKEAEDAVVAAHVEKNRGSVDTLDGHALYARLKVAMGLAMLEDRRDINSEDWRLSGLVMLKSDATRAMCKRELQAKQAEVEAAKAKGAGRSELIRSNLIEESDMAKACTSLLTKLTNESPEWVNTKPLRDRLGKRRELFGEAIEKLMDTGQVEMQEVQHRSNTVTQYRLKS
jgi:Bifunctional DNA primase/polymerase, N-terminal